VKAAFAAAAALAAVAVGAAPPAALATNECRGLQVCVRIAGPWVVVPVRLSAPRPQVQYQLTCPKGFVVGGLDAELTDRAIDVSFVGSSGSPVNPGITTSRSVVFVASYVGTSTRVQSFRPHAGCIPSAGGGTRTPTAVSAVVPPGKPTVRRVRTVRVQPSTRTVVVRCTSGERLVAMSQARGFFTKTPPSAALVATVSAHVSARGGRVTATVRGDDAVTSVRAVVQVAAVCAGGK
jgi:hypothetical protein